MDHGEAFWLRDLRQHLQPGLGFRPGEAGSAAGGVFEGVSPTALRTDLDVLHPQPREELRAEVLWHGACTESRKDYSGSRDPPFLGFARNLPRSCA